MAKLSGNLKYRLRKGIEKMRFAAPETRLDLEKLGLERFYLGLIEFLSDKHAEELKFQREWVGSFENNAEEVRDYWEKYRFLDEIKQKTGVGEDDTILDVGCGISTVLHFLEGERYGVDPLAGEYIEMYDYPEGLKIITGKAEDLPFEAGKFDIVFSSNALDHVTDPGRAVEEIKRVLEEGGFLVLTVEIFKEKIHRGGPHPHSFTRQEVMDLVSDFDVLFEETSPWIGLRKYVEKEFEPENEELILILEK